MGSLRLFRVTFVTPRRGRQKRRTQAYVKVPYGGAYAMTEVLTRMVTTGQLERFEVAAVPPKVIPSIRDDLKRWLPALTESGAAVDWTA